MKRKKIGILGGGQLARMMAVKAHSMGLEPYILSNSPLDPACQVTRFWVKGSVHRLSDLNKFLAKTDLVTFENEFVNTDLLTKAMKNKGTKIIPRPSIIRCLQDRRLQKNLLRKHRIPTAPFLKVDSFKDLTSAYEHFNQKLVLKKRLFGYDGYGTFIIKNKRQLKEACGLFPNKTGFIAEAFIPFKKELAVILASHKNSKPIHLPPVETFQKNFRCYWVKGPISHPLMKNFISLLKKFIQNIHYEGVIAFELFQNQNKLLVNEIAPRVHNSGHYSLDALSRDQFTLHLESILRKPLYPPKLLYSGFAMLNRLGGEKIKPHIIKREGIFLHEYGKKEERKGRKMGHLNSVASSPNKALSQLLK